MGLSDRENRRKKSGVVSAIAGINQESTTKGRPKAERETKERKSFAILPSIYEDVVKIAYIDRVSISEIIAKCLEEFVEKNHEKVKEYDELKNK